MKKVIFKKLSIKNFLSIGNEPLEINFQEGLNVITGFNRDEDDIKNGCGKSTILDAFYFALFGNTMRELSKLSFIVNRKNGKHCEVALEADIEDNHFGTDTYLIERKLAPQSLKLWKNGTDITKSTTAETSKFIEEVFSAEKDIFQNCILMRANNTVPFMAKKKQEKKNFIETIFNLNIFSLMSRLLKEDIREIKGQYSLEKNTMTLHESNIADYKKQLQTLLDTQAQNQLSKEAEINELKEKISAETKKLNSIKVEIDAAIKDSPGDITATNERLKVVNVNLQKLQEMKFKLEYDEKNIKKNIQELQNENTVCPTCGQEYTEEHKCNIEQKKTELINKLQVIARQLKLIYTKVNEENAKKDEYDAEISKINANNVEIRFLRNKISECERILAVYRDQIIKKQEKQEVSGINNFETLIKNTETALENVKKTVDSLEKELGKMNICEHILGEYGVRAYIVNKLLDMFNNRIMYYLSAIKSTFNFRFNEYFEEEIKDSNGIICLYNNCSGAEMKKIDLAISFAINDMLSLQKQISYNVIFFDEILDSSVDDKSLNIILNFISEHTQKEHKAVYIISHKSGAQIPYVNEVVTVEKVNGFTKRIYE